MSHQAGLDSHFKILSCVDGLKGEFMADFLTGFNGLIGDPYSILLFFAALIGGLFFSAIPGVKKVNQGAKNLPITVYMEATKANKIN